MHVAISRGRGRKRRQRRAQGRSQQGRGRGGRRGGYTQRGGRGRGGQTRPYTQTVSLTINSYYYYIITIRVQRQCIATLQLTVKITIIIDKTCRQNV